MFSFDKKYTFFNDAANNQGQFFKHIHHNFGDFSTGGFQEQLLYKHKPLLTIFTRLDDTFTFPIVCFFHFDNFSHKKKFIKYLKSKNVVEKTIQKINALNTYAYEDSYIYEDIQQSYYDLLNNTHDQNISNVFCCSPKADFQAFCLEEINSYFASCNQKFSRSEYFQLKIQTQFLKKFIEYTKLNNLDDVGWLENFFQALNDGFKTVNIMERSIFHLLHLFALQKSIGKININFIIPAISSSAIIREMSGDIYEPSSFLIHHPQEVPLNKEWEYVFDFEAQRPINYIEPNGTEHKITLIKDLHSTFFNLKRETSFLKISNDIQIGSTFFAELKSINMETINLAHVAHFLETTILSKLKSILLLYKDCFDYSSFLLGEYPFIYLQHNIIPKIHTVYVESNETIHIVIKNFHKNEINELPIEVLAIYKYRNNHIFSSSFINEDFIYITTIPIYFNHKISTSKPCILNYIIMFIINELSGLRPSILNTFYFPFIEEKSIIKLLPSPFTSPEIKKFTLQQNQQRTKHSLPHELPQISSNQFIMYREIESHKNNRLNMRKPYSRTC